METPENTKRPFLLLLTAWGHLIGGVLGLPAIYSLAVRMRAPFAVPFVTVLTVESMVLILIAVGLLRRMDAARRMYLFLMPVLLILRLVMISSLAPGSSLQEWGRFLSYNGLMRTVAIGTGVSFLWYLLMVVYLRRESVIRYFRRADKPCLLRYVVPIGLVSVVLCTGSLWAKKVMLHNSFETIGGTVLTYSVDTSDCAAEEREQVLRKLISQLGTCLEQHDVKNVTVERQRGDQIRISVAGEDVRIADTVQNLLKTSIGILEFRILPTVQTTPARELEDCCDRLAENGPANAVGEPYVWIEIQRPDTWSGSGIVQDYQEKKYVLCSNRPEDCLLHNKAQPAYLDKASSTTDHFGLPAVGFTLNEIGADRFYEITSSHSNEPLCILYDGKAASAPLIQDAIRSTGVITGQFTQAEVESMIDRLNNSHLFSRLSEEPVSVYTVTPK